MPNSSFMFSEKFPEPLSKEEQNELAQEWMATHSIAARNKLVAHSLGILGYLVRKSCPAQYQSDCFSHALIYAIQGCFNTLDPSKGTFAVHWYNWCKAGISHYKMRSSNRAGVNFLTTQAKRRLFTMKA